MPTGCYLCVVWGFFLFALHTPPALFYQGAIAGFFLGASILQMQNYSDILRICKNKVKHFANA
ncbi:hypothetical protein IJ00_08065 [Calothrix sp. 336/3]|nr:hypothetical protein IJ00_08065 [Calothrix sp. 336/3]